MTTPYEHFPGLAIIALGPVPGMYIAFQTKSDCDNLRVEEESLRQTYKHNTKLLYS
jgi:hypothetical protein